MVILVVATTADPASIGPAAAFLAMPGWTPGPFVDAGMVSYANGNTRLLKHDRSIVVEDDLDRRWEEATGEPVSEVIFLSRHTAVTNRPALTVHPIGVPHLRTDEIPPQGGRPGWAAPPNPRIGPWFRLLKKIAQDHGLIPEFEVTLEATHHGPVVSTPTLFLEIGSTEEYWGRQDAAQVIALVGLSSNDLSQPSSIWGITGSTNIHLVHSQNTSHFLLWHGLGLEGGISVGVWDRSNCSKVLLGIGGGHYVPRHMDIVQKEGVWVGHLLSGYSLPMEEPSKQKANGPDGDICGTWKQSIKVSFEATRSAFPGGVVLAHLDHKSMKGWQKNAILRFLSQENIQVGKPEDFSSV